MSSVMYARRAADQLNATSNSSSAKGGVFTAATFHYSEDSGLRKDSETHPSAGHYAYATTAHNASDPAAASMATYANGPSPPTMYVRALYDYDADDRTSLSFRQGDIIQVITQLESGWWDGIINNVRGWFPSNYCQLIPSPDDYEQVRYDSLSRESDASGTDSEWEDNDVEMPLNAGGGDRRGTGMSFQEPVEPGEEAAFWIPQATADGRLYYYNTLTGVATRDLPLEDPTTPDEPGPRDRLNIVVPNQTRAPQNMQGGYDYEEDEASASEGDDTFSRRPRHRRSYISDGASPTASMEDLSASGYLSRNQSADFQRPERSTSIAQGMLATSYTAELPVRRNTGVAKQSYYDDAATPPVTWNRLVENMQRAVAAYREAVNNAERSEYVRKAEDISDHLRMLLAAGSGTTDNHSGNPSIISSNKALYPHFRDMMSKFSKLVLSSHIAAADWPAPDSYSKCLQEAEGVLQGVYGYVEIARRQRGDDIPRLRPGFVLGSTNGGSWRSPDDARIGPASSSMATTFMEQEEDAQETTELDIHALEQLDELRGAVTLNLTRLDAHLIVREKIITNTLHEQVSSALCNSAGSVVDSFKSYIAGAEKLDIKGIRAQETQVATFLSQKQVLYDLIANLVISCQTVAGPLGDEWADVRGDPFETRLQAVKTVSKQLETALTQITSTLHGILELSNSDSPNRSSRQKNGATTRGRGSSRTYQNSPYGEDDDLETRPQRDTAKLKKLLGEVPPPLRAQEAAEGAPEYLSLDYEGEIAYDSKTNPPQIRGGTLTALVEQLTRHDRMDPSFNNTFLLTYRSFTTAHELFDMLVKRFSIQPPQGISIPDHQAWVEKKQKLVRFRVVNVLKAWIIDYWLESNDDQSNDLLRRILKFATDHVASTNTGGAQPLRASIETRLRGDTAVTNKRLVLNLNTQAPSPLVPKNLKKLKLIDIDPLELARQLTILEAKAYGKVKPYECLNKTWQKKVKPGNPDPAPNVKALIMQSNQLTNWVAEMILNQSDVRKRVMVIKHFINVADKCRTLNNFSTLTSIITALNTASIHRLNRTWSQVNQKTMSTLESLRDLMISTKNFTEYRETLHLANPPCIPFFGVYLTDLTFIEDGIPSVINKTNLINFSKRAKTAEVIRNIQQYQNVPYPLQPVAELQTFISDSMKSANDVHEMYDRSLQLEPREREDEKIARLLSESGFL